MGDRKGAQALRDRARAAPLGRRDLVVDLARVACILLVVVGHLLMVGVGVDPSGAIVLSRPIDAQAWFIAATWAGQVMPLFFALGGFTAVVSLRRRRAHGGSAIDFVRARTLRLATPALPLFACVAIALGVAALAGVDPVLLGAIAAGIGVPLWFLATYLFVQCLVPLLSELHRRAPSRTLVALAVAVVIVDAARIGSGIPEVGMLNVAFVAAFVQQIGFWYADGWFRRRTRLQLLVIAVAAYVLIWPGVAVGWHSPNMLTNLEPPTSPLMLLGIAQMCIFSLLHPPLSLLMSSRVLRAGVYFVASRAVTLYLWHLPIIVAVSAVALLWPGASPEPESPEWWFSRPVVLVIVLATVWLVSLPIARFESFVAAVPAGFRRPSSAAVVTAAVLAFLPAFAEIVWSLDLALAVAGTAMLTASLALDRARRNPTNPPQTT
ncbi:acyltransferase [Agromyces sp. SYSU K20354]|uniref:acyltransferase family protein n=1 Tax=Agromyces cavernae TaxID=2898659 RepID=UPI001E526B80|nr:acyltransferase [Agromyces cavernae]MCD2441258.1 acyltransferase [Agromyces cavernae]